jgi:O-antigen/teichoic acid export membrane protein
VTAHVAPSRLHTLATTVRRPGTVHSIARTAGFNVAAVVAAGLGGIVIARALGPTLRGDYAAVTAWFGIALMVGGMGQPAALCFYVARDPANARQYVATARAMMLVTGGIALVGGILLAPIIGHHNPVVVAGYRIAFCASIICFVGAGYTFALQARDLSNWNIVRLSQPVLSVVTIAVLWRLRLLTLESALVVLIGTMLLQLAWAYRCCRRADLAPGRAKVTLIRPLMTYGTAQIAALTPAAVNTQLDQLVLSQTVPPADLGRYAIAVSLTSLPIPLVSAIGNVAFPQLASQRRVTGGTDRLQRIAVLGSVAIAAMLLIPLAGVAHWLVPLVFGEGYRAAVPLLWILTPGAVFLACGQVVGDLLRGRGRPSVVAWSQGLAAIFTVLLLLILLPLIGVYGAAIASTVSYGVALAVMLRRLWCLPPDSRRSHRKRPIPANIIVQES